MGRITPPANSGTSGLAAVKSADTAVTSLTVVADDPHLSLAVVANAVYLLQGLFIYDGDTAGDFKFIWSAPVGSSLDWVPNAPASNATTTAGMAAPQTILTLADSKVAGAAGAGVKTTAQPLGKLIVGSTAGTFKLQWAQGTSSAVATNLFANSWMSLARVS